jgi:LuxR family maltose regulon positive regulatory protein
VAQGRGDVDGTVAHAQRALDLAGPNDHFSRGAASGFLGLAAWATGDLTRAVDTFSGAVESLRAAGNHADALGSSVVLANMWLGRGRPDEARRLYEQALAAAGGAVLSTSGDLHVGLAKILREAGDLAGADEHLDAASRLGDEASLPENRHRWFTAKSGVLRARGDLEGALALLDEAEACFQPGFFPDVHPLAATKARIAVALGRLDDAEHWAASSGVSATDDVAYSLEHAHLTLALLLVAQHDPAALGLLDRIVDAATSAGRDGSVIEARTIRALAHASAGSSDAALEDLSAAISMGVPVGYARTFLDHGELVLDLLRSIDAPEAAQLLALADGPVPSTSSEDHDLSERELEVLRLLATDLTGPDISERLFISVNTLRTHTKHIFTKLDVNTRRAAVSRASNLGLL